MAPPLQGLPRRLALLGLLMLGLGVAIGFGNMLAGRAGDDRVPHVAGHVSVALAAVLAMYGAARLARTPRAPRDAMGLAGRALTLLGLGAYALSLLLEALAAYVEGGTAGPFHEATRKAGAAAFAATTLGLLAWTYAAARVRLVPRWALLVVGAVAAYAIYVALRALGVV